MGGTGSRDTGQLDYTVLKSVSYHLEYEVSANEWIQTAGQLQQDSTPGLLRDGTRIHEQPRTGCLIRDSSL